MAENPASKSVQDEQRDSDRRKSERRSLPSKSFNTDRYIFREHESGQEAFIIKHGQIEIFKNITKDGAIKETSIAILSEGQMFGEMALIDDKPRMASARAYGGPVVVSVITQEQFSAMLKPVNPFVIKLLKILSDYARNNNRDKAEDKN